MSSAQKRGWTVNRKQMKLPELTRGQQAGIGLLVLWSLAWKGASLWRAARDGNRPWFVGLLLVNSAGLLDALYLFRVSRREE
jgi:hypothetical protein